MILVYSRHQFADHAARCDSRAPPDDGWGRSGRPARQHKDFSMGAMVSPDSLAVAIQLSAKLRRPCIYSDHVVGGIGAGPQRLRALPYSVSSCGHAKRLAASRIMSEC